MLTRIVSSSGGTLLIREGDARHRAESAEEAQAAGDDIEFIGAGSMVSRVECDVCSTLLIREGDARHRAESAEEAQAAGDDIEFIGAGAFGFRVECDVFRMINQDTVATFKCQYKSSKWHGSHQAVNLGSDLASARHEYLL